MSFEPIVIDSEKDVHKRDGCCLIRSKSKYARTDAVVVDVDPEVAHAFDLHRIRAPGRGFYDLSDFAGVASVDAEFLAYTKFFEPWKIWKTGYDHGDGIIEVDVSNRSERPYRFRATIRAAVTTKLTKMLVPLSFGGYDGSVRVDPGATFDYYARPQQLFRGEALLIGQANRFKVMDLRVGLRSQEDAFRKFRESEPLGMTTARIFRGWTSVAAVAQDVVLTVKNISAEPTLLRAAMWGTAVDGFGPTSQFEPS